MLKVYKPGERIGRPSICIYGRSGVGKTTLIATMPGAGLIMDTQQLEGGNFVLEGVRERNDIDVVDLWTYQDIDEVFLALYKKDKTKLPNVENYKWVAIDSATGVQQIYKRKVVKERPESIDPADVGLREWGKIGQHMGELVFRFKGLPYVTLWIAQERKFSNNDEPVTFGPDVSPSALAALMPTMILTGRLYRSGSRRLLRVQPDGMYQAKSRAKKGFQLPEVIRDPNLDEILRYMLGKSSKKPRAHRADSIIVG